MPAGPLRLVAFARGSHVEIVAHARDALGAAGASILDFHMFSNAILCLNFEIGLSSLAALDDALDSAGIRLDAASRSGLAVASSEVSSADADARLVGSLSVNMVNDEPVLRIQVPAVPG